MKRQIFTTQSNFAEVRKAGGVYVDKTKQIYDCFNGDKYYFLARPRRFGKSLLCSTLRELFLGNKKLFKNLWIEKSDWKWEKHPVIHFDMTQAAGSTNTVDKMEESLYVQLRAKAEEYGVVLPATKSLARAFTDLIELLYKKTGKGVVVIIDEYDKPVLDLVDKPELRTGIHAVLRDFYSPLKPLEKYLRFVFLTGVYKFTQTSIFSNLNNLQDITFDRQAGTLIGYTEKELREYFAPEIALLADKLAMTVPQIVTQLQEKYNGYHFGVDVDTGELSESVYNSFAINNVFARLERVDRWFESGSPTFLIEKIQEDDFEAIDPDGLEVSLRALQISCSPDDITATTLLYYAGYATMFSYDPQAKVVQLRYPNIEVSSAIATELMALFRGKNSPRLYKIADKIAEALKAHDFDVLKDLFNTALAQLTHQIIVQKEKYFQTVILLIIQMGRVRAEAEIPTNDGRMDIVIELAKEIIIVELKFNTPAIDGLKQIKAKDYAKKYRSDRKKLTAIGLSVAIGRGATKKSCVVDVAHEAL